MERKLFCELSPFAYKISETKGIILRQFKWLINSQRYVSSYSEEKLPIVIYKHKSLIRRKLGEVDMRLQENKAKNLSIAAPSINGIIIKPQEVFSFWRLVGRCTESKGYKEGLFIKGGNIDKGIGGGMCQFTNLIHWMVLHSPLTIIEHHHHNHIDMFPDYGRTIPFGTGTSIMYNYLDYQFENNTEQEFQLITYTTDKYLCGELRSDKPIHYSYHIQEENSYFIKMEDAYYRTNEIYRKIIDKRTGNKVNKELIVKNNSKVMYDIKLIPVEKIKTKD